MQAEQPPGDSASQSPSVSEAMVAITTRMHQELVRGRVDSERDDFERILYLLKTGTLSPREALEHAERISAGRQEY